MPALLWRWWISGLPSETERLLLNDQNVISGSGTGACARFDVIFITARAHRHRASPPSQEYSMKKQAKSSHNRGSVLRSVLALLLMLCGLALLARAGSSGPSAQAPQAAACTPGVP